jgi:microsomal dipeptidase-like Zn-dependent dipeptidase
MRFADIHIHSTLKPYIFYAYKPESPKGDLWYQDKPKEWERDNFLVRFTESDFTTLVQSNVKIAFLALYPFEQGWFNSKRNGEFTEILDHFYTDFPFEAIDYIKADDYNYFQRLKFEYDFLEQQIRTGREVEIDGKKVFITPKIPKDKEELNKFLSEENTLVLIPTIEGAHSLINGNAKDVEHLAEQDILKNIDYLKKHRFSPFFITFAHHFYNGMCGQAQSLFSYSEIKQHIIDFFISQKLGLDKDLNKIGRLAIKKLLAIDEFKDEKRILIDVKHMNYISRLQFYDIVRSYNKNNPDKKIPIIASHMGYSGKKECKLTHKMRTLSSLKPFTRSKKFDAKCINLCDKDVLNIFESEGLIGVNLDQKIISSKKIIKKSEHQFSGLPTDRMQYFWAKQIVANITSMAYAVIKKFPDKSSSVWNIFTIGSDFDGFINPVDAFVTTADYPRMEKFIAKALENDKIFMKNNFGYSPDEIAKKIMFDNAKDFLNKYYFNI